MKMDGRADRADRIPQAFPPITLISHSNKCLCGLYKLTFQFQNVRPGMILSLFLIRSVIEVLNLCVQVCWMDDHPKHVQEVERSLTVMKPFFSPYFLVFLRTDKTCRKTKRPLLTNAQKLGALSHTAPTYLCETPHAHFFFSSFFSLFGVVKSSKVC